MADMVTITVPADSLEAALHGTRLDEEWESNGFKLELSSMAKAKWHRVAPPVLRCPYCGKEVMVSDFGTVGYRVTCSCGVAGPACYTFVEAREAFRRMAGGGHV